MFFIAERKFQEEVEKEVNKRMSDWHDKRCIAEDIDRLRDRLNKLEGNIWDLEQKVFGCTKVHGDTPCNPC